MLGQEWMVPYSGLSRPAWVGLHECGRLHWSHVVCGDTTVNGLTVPGAEDTDPPRALTRLSWLELSLSEGCASWGWVAQRMVRETRHQQPPRPWDRRYLQPGVVAQAVEAQEAASLSCRQCWTQRWTQKFRWWHRQRWLPATTATRRDLGTILHQSRTCPSTSYQRFAKSLPQERSRSQISRSSDPLEPEGFVDRPSWGTTWMLLQANGPRRNFQVQVTSILGTRIGSASGPACWLLEAGQAEHLDAYSEFIRSQVTQFGDEAWWLICRADSRLRSEHLERIRRSLRTNPQYGYTEAAPWSACFAASIKDSDFWLKELGTPATLWLARNKRDSGGGNPSSGHRGDDSPESGAPHKKKKAKKHTGEDKSSVGEDGTYTLNRKGIEICVAYNNNNNNNKCGSAAAQGKCKNKRSHQCNKCLGPHQAIKCPGKGKRFNWPTMSGVSGGGSPAAVGASRTEDTPHGKRPSSPSGPPTKKQRTDIEKSRDRTIVSSEEEGRGQGFRASGTASGILEATAWIKGEGEPGSDQPEEDWQDGHGEDQAQARQEARPFGEGKGIRGKRAWEAWGETNKPKERDQPEGLYPVLDRPPRSYGYWSGSGREDRPRALVLFSGRARPGDLHQSLVRLGWTVCSVDTLSPKPTNLLDDAIYSRRRPSWKSWWKTTWREVSAG